MRGGGALPLVMDLLFVVERRDAPTRLDDWRLQNPVFSMLIDTARLNISNGDDRETRRAYHAIEDCP